MKVLIVYSDKLCSATTKCTFELAEGLKSLCTVTTVFYEQFTENMFKEQDIVIFQRLGGNGGRITQQFKNNLLGMIKRFPAVRTIYFIDDLLINDDTVFFLTVLGTVMVPQESFKKHFSKYNQKIIVSGAWIDSKKVLKILDNKKILTFLWASTANVGEDFMKKLVPEIIKKYPDCRIIVCGGNSTEFNKYSQVLKKPNISYEDFVKLFKEADVYLNPVSMDAPVFMGLIPKDFLDCKSEIKFLHAALARVPCISSRSHAYEKAMKNRVTGYLVDNDIKQWMGAINEIVTQDQTKILDAAYADVMEKNSLEQAGKNVFDLLTKVLL